MAAYAALVSLMNTIQDIMNHPKVSTFFDDEHTHTLLEKTSSLLNFVEANNESKEAEDLEREIVSAVQAIEDVIDVYVMDQIHAEANETSSIIVKKKHNTWINVHLLGITSTHSDSFGDSSDLQQKIQDLDIVMKKVNEFKGKQRMGEKQRKPLPVMEIEETAMVGLDAEFERLLHELIKDPRSSPKVISIVGMGGTGKTTLAKNIYENKLIKEYFDIRAWATLSQHHNLQEIFAQLLCYSGLKLYSDESRNELGVKLHRKLFARKYLIILDDIWSVQAWDEVKLYFPDNNNGSKIVLTTRRSSVAKYCDSSPFMMSLLDDDNSWKLFSKKAFKNEACPPELQEVGEEIVKLCKGLALSIVVMGGLLSKSPRTVEYWESFARAIKSISGGSLDVLSLSYNQLPTHLKPCFLYMGIFEEDFQIHVSEVVRLWIGEGFVKSSASRVLEEIAEEYIHDMIDRNLILVRRRHKNGNIRCLGIHDLVRDMCIRLGEQQQLFSLAQTPNSAERRLIHQIADFEKDRISRARSILASYLSGKPIKQGLLRVLKTRSKVYSPVDLYENVNLRHLAYQESIGHSSFWELPISVSRMWNLKTLIIQGYSINAVVVAPREIWKMGQLRHVECGNIYLPPYNRQDQDELLILENLQTLKTVLNPRLCKEVCEIIPNIIKLNLCYHEGLYKYDDCLIEYLCNLDSLHKLEYLKLEIYFKKLVKKPTFPNSLTKLSLNGCGFNWDDLEMIGSLPQLEVLVLSCLSVVGDRWSPSTDQFLSLKFLKLDEIDLEYWDADYSHFPVLEKLVLCFMSCLEEIPPGIGDISTLELIRVQHCTDSVKISAVKIKENQLEIGDDSLQIHIRMYEDELKDFTEKVELEGLSISDFQLEIE